MIKKTLVLSGILILTGCSTMTPPRYSVSVDNVQALKKYENAQLIFSDFEQSATYSSNCRLMGPIEPADNLSMPDFVAKAFNDELKMADIYSENGTKISGDITNIAFSSITGLTNGYWDISVKLTSSNGNSIDVDNKYEFKSGFDAITACNATADALTPAVQDLIKKTVTDPSFSTLF